MVELYRGAGKSLARPTSRCILFDDESISFDASLVIYTNSINIPPIMIINRIYDGTWRIETNDELDKIIRHKNIINHIKAQRLS
jgi:hypothetical protein